LFGVNYYSPRPGIIIVADHSIEKFVREGEIPHFRLGKKLLFRKNEIDDWLEQYRVNQEDQDLKKIADEAVRKVLGEGTT